MTDRPGVLPDPLLPERSSSPGMNISVVGPFSLGPVSWSLPVSILKKSNGLIRWDRKLCTLFVSRFMYSQRTKLETIYSVNG